MTSHDLTYHNIRYDLTLPCLTQPMLENIQQIGGTGLLSKKRARQSRTYKEKKV